METENPVDILCNRMITIVCILTYYSFGDMSALQPGPGPNYGTGQVQQQLSITSSASFFRMGSFASTPPIPNLVV